MNGLFQLGKTLIALGLVVAGLGLLLILGGKIPWIGRLPGDFLIRRRNVTLYFPLATSLIISIVLTLIFMLLRRK